MLPRQVRSRLTLVLSAVVLLAVGACAATGAEVTGSFARTWLTGEDPFAPGRRAFSCWPGDLQPCLATYGYPLGNRYAKSGNIPGGGEHMWEQVFERAVLQVNRYGDEVVVQGRLLGSETSGLAGQPGLPVDDDFRSYYAAYGGLAVFGYPLGPATVEGGRKVQLFERARLEANPDWDPNLQDPVWAVLRGRLGASQPDASSAQAVRRP